MTDLTVTLSFSLIGMTTQLNRAVMTRSLFLETPHGIHAHCGFCIIWVRGHSQNAEANTHLQMLQPPELAGCSAVCYILTPPQLSWKWEDCSGRGLGQRVRPPGGAYLHPVHAGFHLQLLHSLPGLGDAGGAATGHAFLHPAAPETTEAKGLQGLLLRR